MKKYEEAEQDYLAGMKYKDIADKYGVTINTVKSWKSRYWNATKKVATSQKSVHTKPKKVAHKTVTDIAIEELANSDLNDKRKAFVIEFVRLYNATQAYINAYGVDYSTAKTAGPRLLENVGVQKEIKRLRDARFKELSIGVFDLLDDVVAEAKGDLGEYINFGSEELKSVDEDTGKPITKHYSWVALKDKSSVDTKLLKKVNVGKDGVVVELHDRNKARDTLLDWMLKKGRFVEENNTDDKNKTTVVDDLGG
ncbi:terminase small subunit [Convivina praedatoris]|uniref:Phage terminase small subunit n=1 Tax=Convivina praedatoris TaxID=2880963 RepID=A0ABN8H993_9LACO|nr:terminase small subunit [Convivina sp. LMG 32447]CAH1853299.1 hypothetical protein R077815_00788 [Convivina sp. LMG 32447]CAH1854661.1 hypothetical protein LMG032447_00902 [Convivina sp. LMG 32447]